MSIQDEIRDADIKSGKDSIPLDKNISAEITKLKNDARDFSRDSRAIIYNGVHITTDYLRDLASNLKKSALVTLRKTEAHINENPRQSAIIAFVAGIFANIIFRRKRR